MRNIVVVECISTGTNYIQDIVARNYNPIVLEMAESGDNEEALLYKKIVHDSYERIKHDFDLIHEKDTYEETLAMVKELDPVLVVPGNEKGVILATKLANDLNLLCNPIENLDAFTLKNEMQNRLAENNLRSIRGRVVKSVEEAVDYYDSEGLKEVVVKPIYGAASVGVNICQNRQEMIDSISKVFNQKGYYGNESAELLIQERINGDEYVVNTVSCGGVHRVTLIWKYNKIKTSEGGHIYDSFESINELDLGEAKLVEYAYDVADALGIQYGPVHGEYMIDEKGPVLIEVNCRPCGANMDADFLDSFSGQHETDSSLDSYLNPKKFDYELKKGYKLFGHAALKLFIVPNDLIAESSPMNHISNKLKSHYKTALDPINETQPFLKTQDLETSCGTVFLSHSDGYQVKKDLDFLRSIEKYAFQLVLSEGLDKETEIDEDETFKDIHYLLENAPVYGTTLFVTDSIFDDVDLLQVTPDKLDALNGEFDCVVVNLNKSILDKKDDYIASLFLKIFNKVRLSGLVFIPKSTYGLLPNGRVGAEALVRVMDLKIELPLHNLPRMIIASKR
ncbi:MAG: ATP-grasp domain-containing protein [Methanobrevibacter sp.]|uniref:ATP-grasp domain-containing protein n=1 Tax=Methanobrevibacter sp. TaxID=66852 RepID=UPI0025D945C2|nr:ATP-grasp domain-containing protein [Methanobrevibacter sp.]MBQ6099265.1 ATP-grasp domain-containing protein [Methanobrevibacter sp.]